MSGSRPPESKTIGTTLLRIRQHFHGNLSLSRFGAPADHLGLAQDLNQGLQVRR